MSTRATSPATTTPKAEVKGEAKGEAKSVLLVLGARGIPVSEEARARISGCTDLALLESWVVRAMTAGSVEELFDSQ